jgi:squalene-hopene/tetraprenyl-beta-curcumene cyclase
VTTLSVNALLPGVELPDSSRQRIIEWLLRQQYRVEHPYTHAAPGGWAWTNLPGGVPDADDTAGAVLALRGLNSPPAGESSDLRRSRREEALTRSSESRKPKAEVEQSLLTSAATERWAESLRAAVAGIVWLLDLQNRDGGIPTFCRGWGALPFDRSSPDLTAHAIRAWLAWQDAVSPELKSCITAAISRAIRFLANTQRSDGAWLPLWFGHQESPDDENPLYGTARVLSALAVASRLGTPGVSPLIERAVNWLVIRQNPDGGWSGARGATSSVEETALGVEALAELCPSELPQNVMAALELGVAWVIDRVNTGQWREPSPIGFYFARLWYYEKLYPLIFSTAALGRVARQLDENRSARATKQD